MHFFQMVHERITHETVVHSPRSISPSEVDLVTDQSIKGKVFCYIDKWDNVEDPLTGFIKRAWSVR